MLSLVKAKEWIDARLPIPWDELRHFLSEPVPNHMKLWWFALGGTPLYLFMVQVVTGLLLTFYYVPDPAEAYNSVSLISHELPYGWWLRSLHRWGSHFMIAAVILHIIRVFFTGAYRKPREVNWMVGVLILGVVLGLGFTGYSLVYEQLSYWAVVVGANLASAVPLVGTFAADLLRGGPAVGANTLTRVFMLHIAVFPVTLVCLLGLHLTLMRMHGVTEFKVRGEEEAPHFAFFPHHALTELLVGTVLITLLTAMACIFPPGLGERANPLMTPDHIKPEWYFYFTFRWLKLTGLNFAVLSLGFFGFMALTWPFTDRLLRSRRPGSEASVWVGLLAVAAILILTVWEALATH